MEKGKNIFKLCEIEQKCPFLIIWSKNIPTINSCQKISLPLIVWFGNFPYCDLVGQKCSFSYKCIIFLFKYILFLINTLL